MGRLCAIWKKELRSYFNSPIAYFFLVFFLLLTSSQFFVTNITSGMLGGFRGNFYIRGEATLADFFSLFPLALALLVPTLCIRLWPEERKSGTIETLMTMPIRAWEVVLGKFFAMVTILTIALVLSLAVPFSVAKLAVEPLDWGPVVGGYVAALLMGSAYCAVGLFASSLTREQVVALLVSFIICLPLALMGTPLIDLLTPNAIAPAGKFMGFTLRFDSIAKGVLDLRDMFYFLSFTTLFVFLNISIVESRRLR
jgi:ABC-2 type transport system permease protein